MNLRDLLRGVARRWYVVLAGLLVTGAACAGLYAAVPLENTASANVILLPPQTVYGEDGNPFLYLGGLSQAVDVLSRTLNAEDIRGVIEKENPDVDFEIGADSSSTGPVILITAKGADASAAIETMYDVLDATPGALESIQVGLSVPPNSLITVETLAADSEVEVDPKNRLQAVIAAAAAGFVASLLLTGFIDARLVSRAARRAGDAEIEAAAKAEAEREAERARETDRTREDAVLVKNESTHPRSSALTPLR
ncbi:MAG: hypothetical protein JWM51_330 [Microbacteriaceae bacterium]|nr:hypothetical protein [Microbacteriaceae bacterium]